MTAGGEWVVRELRESVAQVHARPLSEPVVREVWRVIPADRAIVLGSTQSVAVLDLPAVAEAGLSVVRRRSGGGAVLVSPESVTWFDVIIPVGDPLWRDDVGQAAHWLGEVSAGVVQDLGCAEVNVEQHMVRTRWSSLVCFSGRGPGEVTVGGRKTVGVSQRRNRAAARFQMSFLRQWDPDAMAKLFALSVGDQRELAGDLHETAGALDVAQDDLEESFLAALSTI